MSAGEAPRDIPLDDVGNVQSTFFGTSSVYVTDGHEGLFIDAFLSRPSLARIVLGRVSPNVARIQEALELGRVQRVDAVFVAHSHVDHVLDAPEVARRHGGRLFGSASTIQVGRGAGLPESSMHLMRDGDTFSVGNFTVEVVEGLHSPGNRYPGLIENRIDMPTRARELKDGGCFSFLIDHPRGSIFVHPSANFVPHRMDGLRADLLYLGVGALGAQDEAFHDGYRRHVIDALRPSVVVPIHWDNFGRRLSRPLRPLPRIMDNFAVTRSLLADWEARGGWALRWQKAFETLDLSEAT